VELPSGCKQKDSQETTTVNQIDKNVNVDEKKRRGDGKIRRAKK
jgi:hypothetical protein